MFRFLVVALRHSPKCLQPAISQNAPQIKPSTNYLIPKTNFSSLITNTFTSPLLSNPKVQEISNSVSRPLTKYSFKKGTRKTTKAVLKRFYRLDWGGWIRTKCGRNKKLWKKHAARRRRLNQHVMCNATQNTLLDKMVTSYWRRPKYYVEDPYEPYHTREEHPYTYKKPKPYVAPDNTVVY